MASGDESSNLVIWDIKTARILRKYRFENEVTDCIEWCPGRYDLISVCNDSDLYLIQPALGTKQLIASTKEVMAECQRGYEIDAKANDNKEKFCKWRFPDDGYGRKMLKIEFGRCISQVVWHAKGDYFATMANNVQSTSQVLIHSVMKHNTAKALNSAKGIVQAISFHPTKPNFFVATHMQVF